MIKIVITRCIVLILLCTIIVSCDREEDNGAVVTFISNASHSVDIFYNRIPDRIPEIFDPTKHIPGSLGTVKSGGKLVVQLPATSNELLPFVDIFYLFYKIILPDSYDVVATGLSVYAEQTTRNIPLLIESGGIYDEYIRNPPANELRFTIGIVKVRNMTTGQLRVENKNEGKDLSQLGRENVWLTVGQIGFFQIKPPPFSAPTETWTMDFLQSRDNNFNRTSFPSFEMERGKVYSFEINNTGISGPVITNVNPLGP